LIKFQLRRIRSAGDFSLQHQFSGFIEVLGFLVSLPAASSRIPEIMLLPAFQDLIKPQWRTVLAELKGSGAMSVSELARHAGASYMAVKQHCEELHKLGYLDRSRVPRTAVGRPEIFYSLNPKADALFPQAGVDFTLELLSGLKGLTSESMPEKLLFQYFQKLQTRWLPILEKLPTLEEKARKLAKLRAGVGGTIRCQSHDGAGLALEEAHNPLQRVFEQYPRAVAMELRMMETLLNVKITRRELPGGRSAQPRVIFELPLPPSAA
jgi:predicted ArsR family transcriptional regulator